MLVIFPSFCPLYFVPIETSIFVVDGVVVVVAVVFFPFPIIQWYNSHSHSMLANIHIIRMYQNNKENGARECLFVQTEC